MIPDPRRAYSLSGTRQVARCAQTSSGSAIGDFSSESATLFLAVVNIATAFTGHIGAGKACKVSKPLTELIRLTIPDYQGKAFYTAIFAPQS